MTLRDRIRNGDCLTADGATGTMLQQAGLARGQSPEQWNIGRPEAIRALAAGYAAAGSDIIYTNTFGGNRIRLQLDGMDGDLMDINRKAVHLAREAIAASGRDIYLVASIGPTGVMLDPYGDLSEEAARDAFSEQAKILAAEGVDGFACETFTALEEALLCLEAVKAAAGSLAVFASMAFDQGGRTMMGVTPEAAVEALREAGADVVGANCSVGPDVVEVALRAMRAARPDVPLLAKPNAGLPVIANGETAFPVTALEMAAFATRMSALGVAVIGGCCGTTPEHIRAIKGAQSLP